MIQQPLAPFGSSAIAPGARGNYMIRIERPQVVRHLRHPRTPFVPAASNCLPFINKFPSKDVRVVAIKDSRNCVTASDEFLNVFAVESARFVIGVKRHRALRVNTKRVSVVGGVVNSRPTQILCNSAGITPPICQAQLNVNVVTRRFRDHFVQMDEGVFVPLARRPTKRVYARPVREVSYWPNIVWPTFA